MVVVTALTASIFISTIAAAADSDYQTFLSIVEQKRAERPVIGPIHFDKLIRRGRVREIREGAFWQEYQDVKYQTAQKLTEQVLQDNTAGIVYPGSLLWANPLLHDSRLDPVAVSQHSPVTVTLSSAVSEAASMSFVHDGTFSDFVKQSREVIRNITTSEARLVFTSQVSRDLRSALLKANLSASGWFNKVGAMVDSSESATRTYAILSLDQVYFTLTAEPGATGSFIDAQLFNDEAQARALISSAQREGEPVVVRRVNYGRRLLLIIESESGAKALKRALNFHVQGLGIEAEGDVSQEMKDTWEQMNVHAIVIGGKLTDPLIDTITGNPADLMKNINAYFKETKSFSPDTSAAPLSFEVAYAVDRAQATNYETTDFSGKIRGRRFLAEGEVSVRTPIELTPDSATLVRGDTEMDSDDWTWTKVSYTLSGVGTKRAEIRIIYTAREGNRNKSFGNSYFRSRKTFLLGEYNRQIKGFNVAASGSEEKWHGKGERHYWQTFGSFGPLRDIRVSFDKRGRKDLDVMKMSCDLHLIVELDRQR